MSTRVIRVAMLVALCGCGTRDTRWENPPDLVGPFPAAGALVWVNRTESVAEVLDPSGARAPSGVDILALPRGVAATPSGFLVTGGRGDGPLLDVVTLPSGTRQSISVAHVYDKISVSPDGQFAVLFFDPAAPPAPGGPAARNNNEITVVDLTSMSAQALSLGTESLAPESVIFSPQPHVAAVVMDGTLVLLELDHPQNRVQVPLKLPDGTLLHPQQVQFAPDGRYLYVRTDGSDDVLALDVLPGANDFESAVNFLFFPGASGLQDIVVPSGAGFDRYVAALYTANKTSTAVLLDATGDTSRTHASQLSVAGTHVQDLGGGMLLVWSSSSDVAGWEPLVDRSDEDQLPASVVNAPLVGQGHAFFVHAAVTEGNTTSAALSGVTLVDDGARLQLKQNPLVLGGVPSASAIDPATGLVLLGVPITRAGSGASELGGNAPSQTGSIVTVDPQSLAIDGLVLDATTVQMGTIGQFGFAVHPSTLGDVTFFPLSGPSRGTSRRVYGFLAGHLLDSGDGQ